MPTNKQTQVFRRCALTSVQLAYSDDGSRLVRFPLAGFERVSIQAVDVGGTAWSTAVVTVRVSNFDGGPWLALPTCAVTLTSPGIVGPLDISAFQFLALDITTAQSGTAADFHICGWGTK